MLLCPVTRHYARSSAEDLGSYPSEFRIFYLFRCVLSSLLPLRSVGRSNFDNGLQNLITLIHKTTSDNDIAILYIYIHIYTYMHIYIYICIYIFIHMQCIHYVTNILISAWIYPLQDRQCTLTKSHRQTESWLLSEQHKSQKKKNKQPTKVVGVSSGSGRHKPHHNVNQVTTSPFTQQREQQLRPDAQETS